MQDKKMVFLSVSAVPDYDIATEAAEEMMLYALYRDCIPVSPELLYAPVLYEGTDKEKEVAKAQIEALLVRCDAIWLWNAYVTEEMQKQERLAEKHGLGVEHITNAELKDCIRERFYAMHQMEGR